MMSGLGIGLSDWLAEDGSHVGAAISYHIGQEGRLAVGLA